MTGLFPSTQDTSFLGGLWRCGIQVNQKILNFYTDAIFFTANVEPDSLTILLDPRGSDTLDLPVPGMQITAKAVVPGASGQGSVTFEIENHAYPHKTSPTHLSRIQTNEITFTDSALTHPPVSLTGDTAMVELLSNQYWGAVDVTATYVNGADTVTRTKRWPVDMDGDGLLDAWEDARGGKNMGSCPNPDPAYFEDECADADTSAGNMNGGDGISKLQEYRGVMIGSDHVRLDPRRKEVFFDIDSAAAGQFAIDEVRDQLKLVVHHVSGLKTTPAHFGMPGANELDYLGTLGNDSQTRNYLRIVDRGVANKGAVPGALADSVNNHQNGRVVVVGTCSRDGVSVGCPNAPNCQTLGAKQDVIPGFTLGQLNQQPGFSHQVVNVFDQTISNIWDVGVNSIPETASENFRFTVAADPTNVNGFQMWQATYAANNVGAVPGVTEFVNPFDIMGWTSNSVTPDAVVATMTQTVYHERVTLHEVGHALGIRNRCPKPDPWLNCHPLSGSTVMRSGFGPAKLKTFLPTEILEMDLR